MRNAQLAEEIAYTCWQMYEQQPTGIGPERVKGLRMDLSKTDTREYILRPEVRMGIFTCVMAIGVLVFTSSILNPNRRQKRRETTFSLTLIVSRVIYFGILIYFCPS